MPILAIKLNNVLCFNDFYINFSYPQKLKTSLIDNEYLMNVPTFRYKKVNVIVGANASGKTSLLKCIWHIFDFLKRREKNTLYSLVNNKEAKIEIDFVSKVENKDYLYRLKIKINKEIDQIKVAYAQKQLIGVASYENSVKRLDLAEYEYKDYLEALESFNANLGWNIILPGTEERFDTVQFLKLNSDEENEYIDIINSVFKTLDSSIINVVKSKDADDAYVIEHDIVGKIIVQEGMKISDLPKLSSGTKYGFNISNILYSIKQGKNGIYLIDEQFSYVNSDIEKAFLATIVFLLRDDEQVFMTTHNTDVLDLRLPFHSFYIMKKVKYGNAEEIVCNCISEVENRNNVNPRTVVDNDCFASAPDISEIVKIGERYE